MVVPDDVREPLIRKIPTNNIEPFPPSGGPRHGPHVRQRHVPDVDPREDGRGGLEAAAHAAEDEVADALVGGIDYVQAGQLPLDGAEGVCVAYGGEVEVGVLVCDECPGGLLGQFLCMRCLVFGSQGSLEAMARDWSLRSSPCLQGSRIEAWKWRRPT